MGMLADGGFEGINSDNQFTQFNQIFWQCWCKLEQARLQHHSIEKPLCLPEKFVAGHKLSDEVGGK